MKVLITGFEPNDDNLNASELVVVSLRDHPTQELRQYIDDIDFMRARVLRAIALWEMRSHPTNN